MKLYKLYNTRKPGRLRAPDVRRLVGKVETTADGREVVKAGGLEIPVIGYVNCTGHPLPGDAENAAGIRRFLDGQSTQKTNIANL